MQEYIDILTENGNLTEETALKSEVHRLGLWHASAQVWIVNSKKEVLLQKRAANKDSFPNLWDISVAGHLSAGDTPEKAAVREIAEEIGLNLKLEELFFLKKIKRSKIPKEGFIDNEFNYLFIVKKDIEISKLILQREEVQDVQWMPINQFENELKLNSKLFVPHDEEYYQYIINELRLI